MALDLKQFNGHTVTATDDAIMYDQMSTDYGIIHGCECVILGTNIVHVSAGWILIHGRLIQVDEEDVNCAMPAEDGRGRIYIRLDLMNSENPAQLLTVASGSILPALEQDEDINFTTGVFEMELAQYAATATAVQSIEVTAPIIKTNLASVLTFKDVAVSWEEDNTYADYPYRGTIVTIGTTDEYMPFIKLSDEQEESGIYYKTAFTTNSKTYIYASERPEGVTVIPGVFCARMN